MVDPTTHTPRLRVTHAYRPEPLSPFPYRVDVTVENLTTAAARLRNRRVIDWDVEPAAFDEYVTAVKGNSPNLRLTTNNGFDAATGRAVENLVVTGPACTQGAATRVGSAEVSGRPVRFELVLADRSEAHDRWRMSWSAPTYAKNGEFAQGVGTRIQR